MHTRMVREYVQGVLVSESLTVMRQWCSRVAGYGLGRALHCTACMVRVALICCAPRLERESRGLCHGPCHLAAVGVKATHNVSPSPSFRIPHAPC